tara:strand:+ start:248 stop:547 length:300 start_codon:yes stop_codon:yes gene_type:complete
MEKTTMTGGTYLQGYVKATYEQLLKAFGSPHMDQCDNYKTDVEWAFKFADGTVATIYNWKNGYNYLGEAEGLKLNNITEWHVGGFNQKAVARVIDAIEK